MTDRITLTPYLRGMLLEEICSRLNIVEYYQFVLGNPFTRGIRNNFEGDCPFCFSIKTFVVDRGTGKYFCITCKSKGDFLTLLCEKEDRDLNAVLQVLTGYLKTADERQLEARYAKEVMI